MKTRPFLFLPLLVLVFFSCGKEKEPFQLVFAKKPATYQLGDTLKASIKSMTDRSVDSVVWNYGEKSLGKTTGKEELSVMLDKYKLGKHPITASIFSEGEKVEITEPIKLFYNKEPVVYTYKIINTYPHDIEAYTQGLAFYKDTLYESTGRRGASSLRKVNYKTGEVLQKINLEDRYFGEGIAILNDKIHLLTWRSGKGFVYDVASFEKLKTFDYGKSLEGWGLTTDGEVLYKSDGTEKIWLLDPETHEEIGSFQTVTNSGITTKLNELEWVNGKIYANTYLKDGVAIIEPKNGAIIGLIDFRGLREKVTQHPELDVLNGIAYNENTKKLYVTGKNWDKLFEVEIIKKGSFSE